MEIKGYRELSPMEVAMINDVKDVAELVGRLVNNVDQLETYPDKRWIAIAKTHLQQGFMALTRAVAKPTTF
jgi:hypothetical protein